MRNYIRDQVCVAHPPSVVLGTASFSHEHVYLIRSGEAQLYGVPGTIAATAHQPSYGVLANVPVIATTAELVTSSEQVASEPPPPTAFVQRHMGGATVPIATLGPGECITENLLAHPGTRWYLQASNQLEMIVIPRKEWSEVLRPEALKALHQLLRARATFFQSQLEQTLLLPPSASPSAQVRKRTCAARPNRGHRLSTQCCCSECSPIGLDLCVRVCARAVLAARPSSAPAVHVSHRAPPQQLAPGSFVRGGLGHGVVVPPRGATRPTSYSRSASEKALAVPLKQPLGLNESPQPFGLTKSPMHRSAPSASSPNLHNLHHWLVELETNPAYRAAYGAKQRPGSAGSLRARGGVL
jgi:hypothetical protein